MTSFLDLPSEIRNSVYELCLLQQSPINPFDEYYPGSGLTPGVLRVNRQIYREASSFMYAQNIFDLSWVSHKEVASFLERIGRTNAGCIQHIYIDFPDFGNLEAGNITLEDASSDVCANIQSNCANLRTLTMPPDSTTTVLLKLEALDHPKVAIEALELINGRLRAISSLEDIVAQVYDDGPSGYLKKAMESHGWTVREVEYYEEEDWGRSRSPVDDYDDDRDYNYDEEEEYDYDIDNDSDFWRRAGD
ncbi:hypothetical protein ONS95_009500 [Cadophora gregata]|uniref:uncharacterized protein n=1 Tax=Cadophora gregata TaxID=51156 RepID=UPI0026DAE977|nr:uncharacterized protein ONS95_009500 [Cadophora gregata]KAK0124552.1 hypothetical protein ONS95_009500 [Cadophora gregata]KAK0129595.1 hypothetical protein ONS96_000161 [Cadophora gregata f. sp. sojae]